MSKYNNYSEFDFTAFTFNPDEWSAAQNKRYKKWRQMLGTTDDIKEINYEQWLNIARSLDDFWELDQFGTRLFYELSAEDEILDTTRPFEIAFRQVHGLHLIKEVNQLTDEVKTLREKLKALGDDSAPIGFKVSSFVPEHVIEKANKVMEQYKRGEVKTRNTIKHDYKCLEVGRSYRLLNRGNGFELMTHEDYNQAIDQ